VTQIELDAASWTTRDDFYDAFFRAVGAPSWHGRNFDALYDSIATGQINAVEVPYRIVISNTSKAGEDARAIILDFAKLIREIAASSCPIEIELLN
jgi:RNAse (barnase) inhibitor barstar